MIIKFKLNGTDVQLDANSDTRLLEVLRTIFSLTSPKCSCMQGICGSCTVLVDDEPVPSCMIPIFNVDGKSVITLEYFTQAFESEYKRIISAFKKANIKMCGFCDAGKIFTAHKIMNMNMKFSEKALKEMFEGQMCRCSVSDSLVNAVSEL